VLAKLRTRLTFANVVSVIALFVALGGSSYAALTVTGKTVKNSSLTGKDLKNNSVTGKDVKGLASGDVVDRSLLAKDFEAGQLPSGPRGFTGPAGATGPGGATGPTFGRSGQGQCDPDSTDFLTCASTGAINLPTSGRVLLIGASSWDNDLATEPPNSGSCHLEADGNSVGPAGSPFEVDAGEATTTHNPGQGGSIAVTAVSGVLAAGSHSFALTCNETDGSMFFTDATISAVLLGGS
jgi:hypothetical protein